ncbi:tetratricopeptide repeat protein [Hymenobacter latericus]|uniref:tetratricopeptide repeat protein n=1 Tax=Hymenobacter sp. YIM 151858-1 TaxID=2987688 RepID=UPI0022266960|nr:tetratricopeptide repeat protein [Hymenobacter sp. YIM 151858-1]UYZ59093.1 tetratricopeptide repeat protein [Hymenobacter sp. YIM 151858-1]
MATATTDTARVLLLADLSASYRYSDFDSVEYYAKQGLQLARRIGYTKGAGRCLSRIGILMGERGNLPQALRTDLQALQLNEESHDLEGTARTLNQTGLLYFALDDFRPSIAYYLRAKRIYEQAGVTDDSQLVSVFTNLGASYEGLQMLDSAAYYLNLAYTRARQSRNVHTSCWGNPMPYVLRELGLLQVALGNEAAALGYYNRSARAALPENDRRSRCRTYQYLAELYEQRQQTDSSIYYARKALAVGQSLPFVVGVVRTSSLLAGAFEARGQRDSTLKYLRIKQQAEDSLYNPQRIKQLDAIGFAEQQRLRVLEQGQRHHREQERTYALLAGVGALGALALLQWRNNRRQRGANARLSALNRQVTQQKEELTNQRDRLSAMLHELKATQSQLVMREKMASLGELMAGVAYEVQVPMKHIRNLTGVNQQLVAELKAELARLPLAYDELEHLNDPLTSLGLNQAKIEQASQRADSIVRGMLEYASSSPAPRQLTDINAFVEDYLRLTYHDVRVKNKNFHAALLPRLDANAGSLSVVRHDLGRVLISLFAHAFNAVQQRLPLAEEDYVPQVMVSTHRTAEHVEIRIRDNGLGLSKAAQATAFERFLTPAAATEHANLGLSLSHDLIVQGHNGTLSINSEAGHYTEYLITLPLHMHKPAQLGLVHA